MITIFAFKVINPWPHHPTKKIAMVEGGAAAQAFEDALKLRGDVEIEYVASGVSTIRDADVATSIAML